MLEPVQVTPLSANAVGTGLLPLHDHRFGDVETVGLTVGGATTVDTIDRVRHRLEEIAAKRRG